MLAVWLASHAKFGLGRSCKTHERRFVVFRKVESNCYEVLFAGGPVSLTSGPACNFGRVSLTRGRTHGKSGMEPNEFIGG